MKKFTLLLFGVCIAGMSFAQETVSKKDKTAKVNIKESKDTKGKPVVMVKDKPTQKPQKVNSKATVTKGKEKPASLSKVDKTSKSNKGHAHGKNKGNLSGKEFGQERAKQAQSKNSTKEKGKNK